MKTSVSRKLFGFALILCMIIPMLTVIEFTASSASTPTYIASIGIAQDGSSSSIGVNDCKSELSGHTIIDRDLNDGAGGDYVYMGYKTTTDPYKAITGIVFRVGENPPASISYGGCTFYLVGGSEETNTSSQGGWIDLNGAAGGDYIYTYVTRDHNYGAPLTTMTVDESSSKSGYSTGTNTSGAVIDLNQDAGGKYLYLHYKRYSATVTINFYHLNDAGKVVVTQVSGTVKHHLEEMKGKPSVPGLVTYDEKPLRRISWREDPSIENQGTSLVSSPSATVATSGKNYYATYGFLTDTLAIFPDTIIRFDANGGSGAPSELRQKDRRDVTAGTSSLIMGKLDFTLPNDTCTKADTCKFLGWSTDKNATKATYAPGQSISIDHNTTLYAIYEPTNYVNGVCTYCGKIQDGNVAVLSKNGTNVFAGATLDAVIAEAQKCTADDKAVVTILQNIDLDRTNQYITSGVFDIDLNGFEIKSIHDGGIFNLDGDSVNVTLRDSGETGKITGAYRGILVENGSKLTVSGGTIRATNSTGAGVDITTKSTVTIRGGTISGADGVNSSSSTLTISGGTIISTGNKSHNYAVDVSGKKATISGGTISGNRGVRANGVTVTISGGTINCKYDLYYKDDGTFKLTMGQNGIGVTFPGDFATGRDSDTSFVSINKMLNTGCAYWAGDTMLSVADNVTGISGKGDITVKAACPHVSFTKQNYVNNGSNHTYTRSCCGITITEDHRIISGSCACGFACSHASGFTNGFCKENGCYEEPALVNGIYQIGNAGQLYSFAQRVNDGEYDACAVLTANIDLERRQWITICSTDLYYDTTNYSNAVYTGTFDGQGHVIRNYTVTAASYVKSSAGLFGTTLGATVKNLGVDNMSFSLNNAKDIRAAAIVGQMLDGTLIENCYVINSNLTPNSYIVGGIAACNYAGTIRNCYTYNVTISAEGRCGNLVSDTRGDISSTDRVGSVINCYTDASRVEGTQSGGKISGCTGNIPDEKFSSGEIAYKLGSAWGQTIGTQEYPVPCGERVYQITNCKNEFLKYSNTDETIGHNWLNNNGFCTVCDAYEPAELVDGYYQIANGGNLFWFAEYINTVDRTASAKLTANIDLENRLWTPIGSTGETNNNFRGHFDGQGYTITGLNVNANRAGAGFFGEVRLGTVENFTIHGNVTVTANNITYVGGVIGSAPGANSNQPDPNGATIRNITSYVDVTVEDDKTGVGRIGGFIGYANHETIIENCSWYGTIDLGNRSMNLGAGGFIGRVNENSAVTIRNCGAYGSIVNDSVTENVGAFMGLTSTGTNTVIENCLFAGSVSGTNASYVTPFGTWNGASKTLTNSYYINTLGTTDADAAKVTADQLASGEIAYKLGSAWGQTIGTEDYPVLGGEKVYSITNCKNEVIYSNTNENIDHNWENGKCTVCGTACDHANQTGESCGICGAALHTHTPDDRGQTCKGYWCTVCEKWYGEANPDAHTFADDVPCNELITCVECGAELGYGTKHTLSEWIDINDKQHIRFCEYCADESTYEYSSHRPGVSPDTVPCNEFITCADCGSEYINGSKHIICDWQYYDDDRHYRYCIGCGMIDIVEYGDHRGGTANCTNHAVCEDCGEIYGKLAHDTHDWSEPTYTVDGNTHTAHYTCNLDASHTKANEPEAHTFVDGKCVCGTLEDTVKLEIVQQPADVTVNLGEKFKIIVEAKGEGLTYQWYVKESGAKEFKVSVNKTSSYAYTMQHYMHNRQVYCVITDANGNQITTETATITRPPMELKILEQPKDAQQEIGQKFSISPKVQGEGLTYQWYYKNAGGKTFAVSANKTSAYAYTMASYMADRQVYCVITDLYGNSVTTDVATISLPPVELKLLSQPTDVSAPVGTKFSISFNVQGDGLTYQWYVKESGAKAFKVSVNKTSAYAYSMQSYMNNRQVYCVITDRYGNSVTTDVATISLPPVELKLLSQPTDVSASVGTKFSVSFNVQGDGLTYQWYVKESGAKAFKVSSNKTSAYAYSMQSYMNNRQVYCVITDQYGNQVVTDVVTLHVEKN